MVAELARRDLAMGRVAPAQGAVAGALATCRQTAGRLPGAIGQAGRDADPGVPGKAVEVAAERAFGERLGAGAAAEPRAVGAGPSAGGGAALDGGDGHELQ